MIHARRSPAAVSKSKSKRKPFKPSIFEFLEPRRLLTTFHGGDQFDFLDAQGTIERIQFFGNITAEVIGAAVQPNNTVRLVNLPGLLNGATSIGGGIGGGSGSQLIGATTVNGVNAGISALASDATGTIYYVREVPGTVQGPTGPIAHNFLQIIQADATGAGTVIAEVSNEAIAAAGARFAGVNPQITGVNAAAFSPVDGRLYFVATGGTANTPVLFSVDVNSPAIGANLTSVPGSFNSAAAGVNIGGIAFDQTTANTATLFAVDNSGPSPKIEQVDATNTDLITNPVIPRIGGNALVFPISGLAFRPNTSAQPTVFATTVNGALSQVLQIDTQTGLTTNLGLLPAAGQTQGQRVGDLTFDPALTDPFTGTPGALIGTDTGTDTIFFVDPALRGGTETIFTIFVSQSDINAGITVGDLPPNNANPRIPEPFQGSVGNVRVVNAQGGPLALRAAPANSGRAYLGARTVLTAAGNDDNIPITSVPINSSFGVFPAGFTTLHAGLIVATGQDLGNFLFGGTVTGEVSLGGSINTFYAGWLLTGNTNGEGGTGVITDPQNFKVAGNINNLTVLGSIGTNSDAALTKPVYVTGFDMFVAGTIGAVHSYDSIVGEINSANLAGVADANLGADQTEFELINKTANFDFFGNDQLGGEPGLVFNNDSFASPEYLNTAPNAALNTNNDIVVDGTIQADGTNADHVDYYAVPLVAGEKITVQLSSALNSGIAALDLNVGVFDPDGRLIASDYNATQFVALAGQPFQFTADRPGVYRFAVAETTDNAFTGNPPNLLITDIPYTLHLSNVQSMAVGAIVASANICDNNDTGNGTSGLGTLSGDLGAVVAGGSFVSASGNTIAVENGSLRAIVAGTIGTGSGATDPEISVPNGNVGLVESTAGQTYFNLGGDLLTGLASAIGGDYQLVSSAGNLCAELIANGNIGTIRAQSIVDAGGVQPIFSADDNHASNNGRIDLIDDAGNLGSFPAGGPSIKVGPSGTLKYLHVLGTVFGNPLFGNPNSSGQVTTFDPLQSVPVIESSGATVTLVPVQTTGVTTPALTVTTYGLDDGGSAVVSVVSTGGLTVQGSGNVGDQGFGIGSITVQGTGNSLTPGTVNLTQNFNGKPTVPIVAPSTVTTTNLPLSVVFSGNTQIDAFDIIGGAFDQIANNTPGGEIVDIHAGSIARLNGSGNIGLNLAHSTAAALLPNTVVSNAFPFNGQRTGVVVSGSIQNVNLASVGNLIVSGSIASISGSIVAPVFATGSINNVILSGDGILPSGTGNLSNAGIYANGVIGNVVGSNTNIRGNIVSIGGIQSVNLQNGSIIDVTIGNIVNLSQSENINVTTRQIQQSGGNIVHPILDLGSVVTNGSGGIISSDFPANNIGVIAARNGFGIFGSVISTLANGFIGSVYADGYGLRGNFLTGGLNVGSITANGNGGLESTAIFSPAVRQSESVQFDPFFGFPPSIATDIDSSLGTTATTPVIPGTTDTGVIENSTFLGDHNLGNVRAFSIRNNPLTITSGNTTFHFSNSIGSIVTTGPINGMAVVTGKLGTLQSNGNLMNTSLTISGRISNLIVHANITDNSQIIAHGKNGNIGKLTVFGNVDGLIEADGGKISTVKISGSLFGKIQTKFIQNLILAKNLGTGSLEITGSAGTIQFLNDLGPAGNTLTVDGKVTTLKVNGNLIGNVNVLGGLNKLQVGGSIVTGSKVVVSKVLQLLQVGADFQAGAVVQAHQVKKVKVKGANAGSIVIV